MPNELACALLRGVTMLASFPSVRPNELAHWYYRLAGHYVGRILKLGYSIVLRYTKDGYAHDHLIS